MILTLTLSYLGARIVPLIFKAVVKVTAFATILEVLVCTFLAAGIFYPRILLTIICLRSQTINFVGS